MSNKLPGTPDNIINENIRSLNIRSLKRFVILSINVQEIISKVYVGK